MRQYIAWHLTAYYNSTRDSIAIPNSSSEDKYHNLEIWVSHWGYNYYEQRGFIKTYDGGIGRMWEVITDEHYKRIAIKVHKTPLLLDRLSKCFNIDMNRLQKELLMVVI